MSDIKKRWRAASPAMKIGFVLFSPVALLFAVAISPVLLLGWGISAWSEIYLGDSDENYW